MEFNKNEAVIVKSAYGIQFFWVDKFYLQKHALALY